MPPRKPAPKPRTESSAGAASHQQAKIKFATGEGSLVTFANAWVVDQTTSGVLVRFGFVDPRTHVCARSVAISITVFALRDLLTHGEGSLSSVARLWARVPGHDEATQTALAAAPVDFAVAANTWIVSIHPIGARINFQWADPLGITSERRESECVHAVTVRMPPELAATAYLKLLEISRTALTAPEFQGLAPIFEAHANA